MHHSKWDSGNFPSSLNTHSAQTEFMISIVDRWGLDLCLEQGTTTRPSSNLRSNQAVTIDLVGATRESRVLLENVESTRSLIAYLTMSQL
jgi:hypothetical protein